MKKALLLMVLLPLLTSCVTGSAYRLYEGEARPSSSVAILEGAQFLRQDWLNRYIDSVRFSSVDEVMVDNNVAYNRIEILPGQHDVNVYFYWDMGTARGLAPALVSYAASRETLSRTLSFDARPGQTYRVLAEPHFSAERQDITTLTHVDFWVEDANGNLVVTRQQGSYFPPAN